MCITVIRVPALAKAEQHCYRACYAACVALVATSRPETCHMLSVSQKHCNEHTQKRLTVILVTAFALVFPKQRLRLRDYTPTHLTARVHPNLCSPPNPFPQQTRSTNTRNKLTQPVVLFYPTHPTAPISTRIRFPIDSEQYTPLPVSI